MITDITEILDPNYSIIKLNRSIKKLEHLCHLVKSKTTITNYKSLYDSTIKILTNPRYKYIFASIYKYYLENKFCKLNLDFIELESLRNQTPPSKKERILLRKKLNQKKQNIEDKLKEEIQKVFNKNKVSKIYTDFSGNTKPISNLSRE